MTVAPTPSLQTLLARLHQAGGGIVDFTSLFGKQNASWESAPAESTAPVLSVTPLSLGAALRGCFLP